MSIYDQVPFEPDSPDTGLPQTAYVELGLQKHPVTQQKALYFYTEGGIRQKQEAKVGCVILRDVEELATFLLCLGITESSPASILMRAFPVDEADDGQTARRLFLELDSPVEMYRALTDQFESNFLLIQETEDTGLFTWHFHADGMHSKQKPASMSYHQFFAEIAKSIFKRFPPTFDCEQPAYLLALAYVDEGYCELPDNYDDMDVID